MSVRNLIDGSFTVGTDDPIVLNISVPSTSTPTFNIPLTFIKNGIQCTMIIGAFTGTYPVSGVSFDLSDPSILPFVPADEIGTLNSSGLFNNGSNIWGTIYWVINPTSSILNIAIPNNTNPWSLNDVKSINYITN